jgi:leucyl aminopeptidase (aminopeptidase T)
MNLPSGRVFVLPKEETMTGKIVIDGSWDGKLLDEPLVLLVDNGVIVNLSGGEMAEKIDDVFEQAAIPLRPSKAARVRTVAEFGFGMNSRSKLIGNMLEDQVVRGSAYFGFGDNSALGGKAMVGVHMRGVMMKPTVELQDVDLIVNGKVTARKK